MEKPKALASLSALAHESRLDIFRLLVQTGPRGLAAGLIAERLGLPAATLSFHLSHLKHANLITARRDGRSLIYAAEYQSMSALLAYLTENCCQGDASACASSNRTTPATTVERQSHETPARARRRG